MRNMVLLHNSLRKESSCVLQYEECGTVTLQYEGLYCSMRKVVNKQKMY